MAKWIGDAAKEIADFLVMWKGRTHGRGDDYISEEQYKAAENVIKATISKHCPMADCQTCKRWSPQGQGNVYGACSWLNVATRKDFGCVQWEPNK